MYPAPLSMKISGKCTKKRLPVFGHWKRLISKGILKIGRNSLKMRRISFSRFWRSLHPLTEL
ncbi:ORF236 [White spot syndrome virus]|uniref:ORF236 n=1 Tax=White spot syndrome virus TaxID=342409 RepID=A0A2D3I711_9VIRU|nr:ORF236 [White spot syndrome virus]